MQPLSISDPNLNEGIQRAIADLEKYYPDRQVSKLEQEHKGLANRLGRLAKQVGYPSRRKLMEAYGFQVVSRSSAGAQGGRPVSTDADAVFAELRSRYESKPLPKTLGELTEQNPDLSAKLKTLNNKSRELFGDSFKEVLIGEGLLDAVSKRRKAEASKEQVEAMVEVLLHAYEGVADRPKTIKALESAHPEYKDEFDALTVHGKQWFGTTPVRYLKAKGLIGNGVSHFDEASSAVIDELERQFANKPDDVKPSTIKELVALAPEYEAQIVSSRKSWDSSSGTTFVGMLRQRGILRCSEAKMRRVRKESVKRFVRNASLEELVCVWRQAGGPAVLASGCASPLLPEHVRGIDVDALVELRETTLCITPRRIADLRVGLSLSYSAQGFRILLKDAASEIRFAVDYPKFNENRVRQEIVECSGAKSSATALSDLIGAEIVGVSDLPNGSGVPDGLGVPAESNVSNEACFAQVRLRYLHSLTTQSMLNLLARAGLITDDDLLGGDEWRSRDYAAVGVPASYAELAANCSNALTGDASTGNIR